MKFTLLALAALGLLAWATSRRIAITRKNRPTLAEARRAEYGHLPTRFKQTQPADKAKLAIRPFEDWLKKTGQWRERA